MKKIPRQITVKNKPYYLYDSYDTPEECLKLAKYYKKRNKKNRYQIMKWEVGYWFPYEKYFLYMSKVISGNTILATLPIPTKKTRQQEAKTPNEQKNTVIN